MHPRRQVAQRLVHSAVPRDAAQSSQRLGPDLDGKMALTCAVIARMSGVLGAVIHHLQLHRLELCGQS